MAHLNFVLCFILFTRSGTVSGTVSGTEGSGITEDSNNVTIAQLMDLLLKMDEDINTMKVELTNKIISLEDEVKQLANKVDTQEKSGKTGEPEIATINSIVPEMLSSVGIASNLTTTNPVSLPSTLAATNSVSLTSTLTTSTTFLPTLEPSPTVDINPSEPGGTTEGTDEIDYEADDEPEAVSNSLLSVVVAIVILLVLGLLIYVSYQYRYQVCV